MMDFAFLIFIIGIVFWINQPSMDKDKLKDIAKSIDKALSKEFKQRDDRILELEKKIKRIEDIIAEKEK